MHGTPWAWFSKRQDWRTPNSHPRGVTLTGSGVMLSTIQVLGVNFCHSLATKANSHSSFCWAKGMVSHPGTSLSSLTIPSLRPFSVPGPRPRTRNRVMTEAWPCHLWVHSLRGSEMCHSKDTMHACIQGPASPKPFTFTSPYFCITRGTGVQKWSQHAKPF